MYQIFDTPANLVLSLSLVTETGEITTLILFGHNTLQGLHIFWIFSSPTSAQKYIKKSCRSSGVCFFTTSCSLIYGKTFRLSNLQTSKYMPRGKPRGVFRNYNKFTHAKHQVPGGRFELPTWRL
jgi:hypothetical protein